MLFHSLFLWNESVMHNNTHVKNSHHALHKETSLYGLLWVWRWLTLPLRWLLHNSFKISQVTVKLLSNLKQNMTHTCCSCTSDILWRSKRHKRHNIVTFQNMPYAITSKTTSNSSEYPPLSLCSGWVQNCCSVSCGQSRNFLITPHKVSLHVFNTNFIWI
jgi:hypothetical protein